MQFTQASALVALLSATAFGIALPQNPANGNHAGTDNGNNHCGDTTIPQPIIGQGPPVDRNDCQELKNAFANAHTDYYVTGPGQLILAHGTCKFYATVDRGQTAILGGDDASDLIGTAFSYWVDGQSGSKGTYITGQNAEAPCDNANGQTQVTVTWQVSS
ncbi:unnamed protein product [Zymoseptoria tritici ST99CH_1A5]|uniref:Ecp2 effector protein-like domain-containing protein n=2 Tax=Zymoseptoria tritici TaxID=1047171 RepID=F9XQ02_ZYMTI|nr:uncharacterized protein MYCGRDRAFT_111636 [Zymoseptoria tritici IPO323]EGP82556.1 hypothetical protein MYCGRDRAFT_111636 [Zymoseptoria tritici IPO323]SMR64485.1 unnamed protein product [Zymoseptoria tritici ST99CH_3D1]SMY29828.1 unnamed protein product [Zymoseptoria tritici ST99CH_1A5]